MSDNHEIREVPATDENTVAILDLARDIALFDAGRDGAEPTDEQREGLNALITRALETFNEDAPEGEKRDGVTIGGRIRGVIDGEKHELDWHLCMKVKDSEAIAHEAMKDALREALRAALGSKTESISDKLARILSSK